jgi:uncharacterized MnhB-related membrane protein
MLIYQLIDTYYISVSINIILYYISLKHVLFQGNGAAVCVRGALGWCSVVLWQICNL